MSNYNKTETANLFLDFLFKVRDDIFSEYDFIKNCPSIIENKDIHQALPPSHIRVIFYLAKVKSSPISQIAKYLSISKSNMTPIIDKLIEYNLVNRYSDSKDRRVLRIELTPKAIAFFDSLEEASKNILIDKISVLSDDDLDTLTNCLKSACTILDKLRDNK